MMRKERATAFRLFGFVRPNDNLGDVGLVGSNPVRTNKDRLPNDFGSGRGRGGERREEEEKKKEGVPLALWIFVGWLGM